MANLVIPRREIWTQQPQRNLGINRINRITQGLEFVLNPPTFGLNCATSKLHTITKFGVASIESSAYGIAVSSNNGGYTLASNGIESKLTSAISAIVCFLPRSGEETIFGSVGASYGAVNWRIRQTGTYLLVEVMNASGVMATCSLYAANWFGEITPIIVGFSYSAESGVVNAWCSIAQDQSAAQTGLVNAASVPLNFANNLGGDGNYVGKTYFAAIWSRAISKTEFTALRANPWQIFAPRETRLFVPVGGGSTTSLTVQGASHAHFADSPSFSMATHLAVAESLHAHAADNVTLATTGTANLVVQEATHAHIADGVTLTTQWMLTVAEALHGHAADNITLGATGTANLAIADATSGHTSDTVALTLNSLLAVFDAIHAHSADNLTLDTSNATALTVQDATHNHSADVPALSLDTWLAIVEAAHGHTADSPTLSTDTSLLIAEALHAHYADVVVLGFPSAPGSAPTVEEIVVAVLAALNATTIPVNIKQVNSITIKGAGVTGNTWGPL